MKLIWHIIKKDIRRDGWALLVWALLFIGQTAIGWVMLHVENFDLTNVPYLQMAAAVLVFLQFVMGYILVTRLVHADAIVGTNMFWSTRPTSAARLLAAKALGALLLFGLLPLLLLLPWWLRCGFGWHEIWWASVETFGWQLLMIAPAFVVASLTDDLGRVLLWTLLLIATLVSWVALLQASFTAALGKVSYGGAEQVYTKLCLSSLLVIFGSAAVAAHQYLTRRFVRSVVLAAAGLGLIALIGHVFHGNWAPAIRQWLELVPGPAPTELVKDISFEVLPGQDMTARNDKGKADVPTRDTLIDTRLRVQGLPDGMQLGVEHSVQDWSWLDGVSIARGRAYYTGYGFDFEVFRRRFSLPTPVEDPETEQWRKIRRAELDARLKVKGQSIYRRRLSPEDLKGGILHASVSLPNSFVAKMRKESPVFTAKLEAVLYQPEVVADLPLATQSRASGGSRTFRLQEVRGGKPLVLNTRPALPRSVLWSGGIISRSAMESFWNLDQAVAVNSVTGDVDWVGNNQSGSQFLIVAGVVMNWNYIQINWRWVIRHGKNLGIPALDPQWVDHTKLVFWTPVQIGSFTREVRAEKYTVTDDYWQDEAAIKP